MEAHYLRKEKLVELIIMVSRGCHHNSLESQGISNTRQIFPKKYLLRGALRGLRSECEFSKMQSKISNPGIISETKYH